MIKLTVLLPRNASITREDTDGDDGMSALWKASHKAEQPTNAFESSRTCIFRQTPTQRDKERAIRTSRS